MEVDQAVHEVVMGLAAMQDLLEGKTLSTYSTLMQANAAMRIIVRKDSGKDWREYVRQLAREEGVEIETDEDLRRFDRKRAKKTSIRDREPPRDPDERFTKPKDGTTRLGFKVQLGLHHRVVQALSCHSSMELTKKAYTDLALCDVKGAVEGLPSMLSVPAATVHRGGRRTARRGKAEPVGPAARA